MPAHIRNRFENPIYQLIIKPSRAAIDCSFFTSSVLTFATFCLGVALVLGAFELLIVGSGSTDPTTVIALLVSGMAGILASLYKGATTLKQTAVEYTKLQVAVSAGMVTLDALQRIVGHQEKLGKYELDAVRGLADSIAPIVRSIKDNPAQD